MGVLLEMSMETCKWSGTQSYTTGGRGPPASRPAGVRFLLAGERDGRAEGGQELAVDAAEPAGREDHDAIAFLQLAREVGDDLVHGGDEASVQAPALHALHEVVLGKTLALRHLAREMGGGHDDGVRAFEGLREVVLEDAGPRRVGARL